MLGQRALNSEEAWLARKRILSSRHILGHLNSELRTWRLAGSQPRIGSVSFNMMSIQPETETHLRSTWDVPDSGAGQQGHVDGRGQGCLTCFQKRETAASSVDSGV